MAEPYYQTYCDSVGTPATAVWNECIKQQRGRVIDLLAKHNGAESKGDAYTSGNYNLDALQIYINNNKSTVTYGDGTRKYAVNFLLAPLY
jgi:hypothetical protein